MKPIVYTISNLNNTPVSVLVVYDQQDRALRLKATLDEISSNAGPDFEFELRPWRSDILDLPECINELLEDLHDCDLLVVTFSGNGGGVISPRLADMIEEWSRNSHRKDAALFANPECLEGSEPALLSLQNLAEKNGVDYVSSASSAG